MVILSLSKNCQGLLAYFKNGKENYGIREEKYLSSILKPNLKSEF
jgi:hypothetical protein